MPPRDPVLRRPLPQKPSYTGKILAVMLGGLFVALVLVAAVKGFGTIGHPGFGLVVGLAVLVLAGLIYWRQVKVGEKPPPDA